MGGWGNPSDANGLSTTSDDDGALIHGLDLLKISPTTGQVVSGTDYSGVDTVGSCSVEDTRTVLSPYHVCFVLSPATGRSTGA